jgi:hypothetical protein
MAEKREKRKELAEKRKTMRKGERDSETVEE